MTLTERLPPEVVVLVPTGMLGAGIQREHIRYGIASGAHAIDRKSVV